MEIRVCSNQNANATNSNRYTNNIFLLCSLYVVLRSYIRLCTYIVYIGTLLVVHVRKKIIENFCQIKTLIYVNNSFVRLFYADPDVMGKSKNNNIAVYIWEILNYDRLICPN